MRVVPREQPTIDPGEEPAFSAFVQAVFGMRRKQMQRVLRALQNLDARAARQKLETLEIDPMLRPESLTPEQFVAVFRATR